MIWRRCMRYKLSRAPSHQNVDPFGAFWMRAGSSGLGGNKRGTRGGDVSRSRGHLSDPGRRAGDTTPVSRSQGPRATRRLGKIKVGAESERPSRGASSLHSSLVVSFWQTARGRRRCPLKATRSECDVDEEVTFRRRTVNVTRPALPLPDAFAERRAT